MATYTFTLGRAVCALSLALVSIALATSQNASAQRKVIYGDDDRLDLYQVTVSQQLQLADSTVALFRKSQITTDQDSGLARLRTSSYSEDFRLCADEPFYNQPSGAFCSGSLVGPDLILTAGHCVRSETSCKETSFVFGFGIVEKDKIPNAVATTEVYQCAQLVKQTVEYKGADYALIRLDRKVTGHTPLRINRSGTLAAGTPLVVIGHPSGLPTKVAGGANVRSTNEPGFFVANLDTYGGNSGSAVFNLNTGEIEGVLVRGERDFRTRAGASCMESNRCDNASCRGEDVTKISVIAEHIPEITE